jgi:hypothetical protein
MPNKKDYPKGFNIYNEPRFNYPKPLKTITEEMPLDDKIEFYTGMTIDESHLGYQLSHYDDDSCTFRKYETKETPNKNYGKELERYNKFKAQFDIESKEWEILAARWKEEEKQETEAREKALFEKLSAKYGKK